MVDLGLPSGRLWAKTNLGAQTESEYGNYYQWAATTPLSVSGTTVDPAADWELCPYCIDPIDPFHTDAFSKYNGSDYDTLQTEDDAVASQFTGYRMPTQDDFDELMQETDNEWTSINGIYGYKFTNLSDSSKYIFLPASGYCDGSDLNAVSEEGGYWSSTLITDNIYIAYGLCFYDGDTYLDSASRFCGYNVRPVC